MTVLSNDGGEGGFELPLRIDSMELIENAKRTKRRILHFRGFEVRNRNVGLAARSATTQLEPKRRMGRCFFRQFVDLLRQSKGNGF